MLGISTALRSEVSSSGIEIIEAILDLGVKQVELEYRISAAMLKEILPFWRRGEISVNSVHNFLPKPEVIPAGAASIPDFFALSSPDEENRGLALKYGKRTLEWAEELGAKAVVLHLGKMPMGDVMVQLKKLYDEKKIKTPEGQAYIHEQKAIRTEKGAAYLQGALRSLDVLAREADRRKVFLGLECRYNLIDFPNLEEFKALFREFSASPVRYWHDVGHATTQENLGLTKQKDFLENFGHLLVGTHLHGCVGYHDHEAPGKNFFEA
ncbi:MAG: TIM barrel protein [Deltaproteobacteria bacterium]|nr:TIM barrel protein [Deltaproteobacteria bacterium]